ncbi:hypothetical protein JTE90_009684 [Oedothorax gibbosus]|uniref:OTU domain-containing protein n=1 Tax=Oedothorax gibbosus TaxID=931172 RepID=A0AAV6V971_9ARAC|nr:hypothetical protein JTE90_009684 [Oedothorax gibbosus]
MLPDEFFWTPQGTIDKKKTAEALIKDESLDITKRYKLACIYCLKSDVDGLWNNIPEDQKKSFYSEKDPGDVRQQGLVVLWTYDIKKEVTKLDNMIAKRWRKCTPYQYAFEYAALGGNKAATEHFLQKLTPKEREESLVRTAGYVAKKRCGSVSNRTDFPKEHYTDVLCFLLSQMDGRQQIEVFKSYSSEVLECFLDWPWQSFFMETAEHMWTFLPKDGYDYLLGVIIDKVVDGYRDCNYQKLFGEFWQQSPISYKRYVINECTDGSLLSNLFEVEDRENITLIVKDATLTEKEELIFSDIGEDICTRLIFRGNWNLVRFFVGECISSKEKIIELREEFKERNSRYYSKEEFAEKEDTWNKFFQLLDDLIQKDDKKRTYLIPVKDDEDGFKQRYTALFGDREIRHISHVRELIQNYNPLLNEVPSDDILKDLVSNTFRNRVVDHIQSHEDEFRGYISGEFFQYLNGMRKPDTWGGQPEIMAMSKMLGAKVTVSGVIQSEYDNGDIPIQLFHVSTIEGGERNHYNFGLPQNIVDAYRDNVENISGQRSSTKSDRRNIADQRSSTKPELIELLLTKPINTENNKSNPVLPMNREIRNQI